MKTVCQRALALLTTLALVLAWAVPAFAAEETYQVQCDVTYDQSKARTMLDMVNAFRTGNNAWYWDESDTNQVQVSGLQPLTYEDYAGQGHRRNMLSSDKTTFAIGHVVYQGRHFGVQESLTNLASGTETAANDTVQPASLEGAAVTLDQTQFAVTGSEIQPSVTVTLDGKTLTEGTDYTVTYTNNKEIGTATVTVTGIGNYAGTAQTTFDIVECVHQWDEGMVTIEATCFEEGVMTYTCTVCHATRTEPIAMKPHTPMTIWGVEPTCTVAGRSDAKICSTCGNTLEDAHELPALGHDWTEWEEVQAPSCTASGMRQRGCNRCGYIEIENLNPLGHDWGEWQIIKEPTCTEEGEQTHACSRCDEAETAPVAALGHTWGEWQIIKEPTCTEEGEQTHACSRCDETETGTIPATGHRYATNWTSDESGHWHACEVCGDRKDQEAHSWEWVVDQQPTANQPGKQHQQCTVCGYKGREDTILTATLPDAEPDTSYRVQMYGNTPESAVQTEMLRQAMNKLPVSAEYDVMNIRTIFYEIALQYKIGESAWTDMEAAGRSVTITLPYPDGTNATDCDFIVTHYMDDNTVEQPAVTETENGLQVTLQGLSPVAVTSYQLQAKEMPKPDTGSEEEKNPPATPTPAPETAPAPSPEATATTVPAQVTAPQSSIPATADNFPLALLVVLCVAGAGGLAVLTFKRRNL